MSRSIPVQGVIDFPIVSSYYQHSFESPKSVKVRHEAFECQRRLGLSGCPGSHEADMYNCTSVNLSLPGAHYPLDCRIYTAAG